MSFFALHAVLLHLWQATLFGVLLSVCIALVPGISARLRHFAYCLSLLRFLVPAALFSPLVSSTQWLPSQLGWLSSSLSEIWMPTFFVTVGVGEIAPAASRSFSVTWVAGAIWFLGTLLLGGLSLARLTRGLAAVRHCQVPLVGEQKRRLESLATELGISAGSVTAYTVPSSSWLGVVGLFRSRVIIPEGLFSELEDREVNSLLLHELMHVKRRDNLLRLIQSLVVALFWFHPFVWWLDRRLRWESEAACDEAVLRLTGANHVYASGLYKATRFALGLNLPGVSGMSRLGLQTRIQAVLNHQNRKESPMKLVLIVTTLVGAFGLATFVSAAPETKPAAPDLLTGNIPATSPAPAGKIFELRELDQVPVVRKQVPPAYPAVFKESGTVGEVVAAFVVDEKGDVCEVRIERSSNAHFNQPVVDALLQWKFTAGMKNQQAVRVAMKVPIVFSLKP